MFDGQISPDAFTKALPENYIEIIKDGISRFTERSDKEDAMMNEAITTYVNRSVEAGRMDANEAKDILARYGINGNNNPDGGLRMSKKEDEDIRFSKKDENKRFY